jgi:hypothetical protein
VIVTCIGTAVAIEPTMRAPDGSAGAVPRRVAPAAAGADAGPANAITPAHAQAIEANLVDARMTASPGYRLGGARVAPGILSL